MRRPDWADHPFLPGCMPQVAAIRGARLILRHVYTTIETLPPSLAGSAQNEISLRINPISHLIRYLL